MSRIGKIARRTFLIGSAAVVGGVAFGVYAVRTPHSNPLKEDLAEGAATFNPWVLIDAEKITLITPHADIGQGVVSSQAALIAEELDLELDQFEVSFGKPSSAYYNGGFAEEGAPFMATDQSVSAEAVRSVLGGVLKLVAMQGTGASTTIPDTFVKLRAAGASARETLKLAAVQKFDVPIGQLKTKAGKVILPDGREISYTELAGAAAALDPVQNVPLRDPSQWRLIGKNMQRIDVVGKSTGTLDFGIDINIPGMLHAAICVNPRQGGKMISFDAKDVSNMRGVQKLVEVTNGVAVVADNSWRAMRAVEAVECVWGPAPYPAEQIDHWETLTRSFNADVLDATWRDDGDAEAAIAKGTVINTEYRSPYVAHAPLEPLNATVLVTDDQVEVWTGHQFQTMLTDQVAAVTGHRSDQVVFHNQYSGGSFGHRLEFDFVKQAVEIANQMRGIPIKLTYSREEDFAHDFPRHIAMGRAKGTVSNGKVNTIDLEIAAPSVLASQGSRSGSAFPGPDMQLANGAWNNPYDIPNYRVRAYRAPELAPSSSWRSVGAPAGGFFFDTALDELIHAAGADPLMERIRLTRHKVSRQVLETVGDMSNWGAPLAKGTAKGVAFVESFGVPAAEVVQVSVVDGAIRLDHVWVACDVGTVVDPVNFENLVQGGVVFGLGHAINCEITYADGMAEQSNYHAHEGMRLYQCPPIEVRGLENGNKIRGIGEPTVPPAAPALGNAIFAATGKRLREMPFNKFIDFV